MAKYLQASMGIRMRLGFICTDLLGIRTSPSTMEPRNPRAAATKKVFHLLEYMVGIGFGGLVLLEMWRFVWVKQSCG